MKAKRLIPIIAAFTCVLFVLAFQFVFTADAEHAHSSGERLSISGLRQNEEVVVSLLFDSRRTVAIFDTTPSWPGEDEKENGTALFLCDLSKAEIEGLDETIAYCRDVREEYSSATSRMGLRYFRDGKLIGEEFYMGFSLPSQLAWYDQRGMRGNPDYVHDYEQLAVQYGVTMERLYRMIPFEMLEKEESNHPPQRNAGSHLSSDDSPASEIRPRPTR
jgi:hypothetical protein